MLTSSSHNETILLRQVAAGNEKAFADLYNNYQEGLTTFVQSLLKSPQLAEDVAQEVFLKIWEQRSELPQLSSFSNYLFIVARNHTFNVLRKATTETAAKGAIMQYIPDIQNDAQEKLVLEGYRAYIQQVLNTLPPQTREVFRLCRQENKSHDEIAALLGITPDAVKRHMMRSNRAFKDSVDTELGLSLTLLFILLTRS